MTAIDELKESLHYPSRADHLESLEQHLNKSSRLARALWGALWNDAGAEDKRDLEALRELASAVSDHASAALYIFDSESFRKAKSRKIALAQEAAASSSPTIPSSPRSKAARRPTPASAPSVNSRTTSP